MHYCCGCTIRYNILKDSKWMVNDIWPIPGKVKLLLISGKKSASLLDHISRFFKSSVCYLVLEKYFQNKNCEAFLSVHEWAHDLYQKCHKRDSNVTPKCHKRDQTKYCIKRNPEFHTKYMKLFVNILSVICVLLNTKSTSENFYFEVILSGIIFLCKVTNVTSRYMDFILDLDEEFNFQRPVYLDSNRMHYTQSKICW